MADAEIKVTLNT